MDRFDPFVKYADVYGDVINWEKDPMNYPKNQNKYFFSDGKTYYEQICKMLRLMSVFKEAFNQIYDNEDEISGAWESFVENLSATAVSGSEPGVTLTWTDDSVNFEFTLVPGRDGADGTDGRDGTDGVGISSISFNSDYTMTITLTNGSVYTSESLRGPIGETGARGPQGEKGEPGEGLNILDVYSTLQDLQTAHPTGSPGEAYQVGTAPSFTLYIWSVSRSEWVSAGTLGSVSPSMSNPLMDGVASAGSSDLYARGDHVHPTDTSRASASDLNNLSDTIISEYLKKTDAVGYDDILTKTIAQSLYQTIAGMSAYLTKTNAASLYQTIAGMSNYMPVDRKASASQLGGIKVGNNLSIDSDGVLSASGNSELTLSGTVNITSSTSPAQTPVYKNVDLKYRASSDYSILILYGTCECRGSGGTTVTTVTTNLTIPNWTKGETRIGGVPFNSSANATTLVIRSNGRVDFELTGSTNFGTYFFPPYRMIMADY